MLCIWGGVVGTVTVSLLHICNLITFDAAHSILCKPRWIAVRCWLNHSHMLPPQISKWALHMVNKGAGSRSTHTNHSTRCEPGVTTKREWTCFYSIINSSNGLSFIQSGCGCWGATGVLCCKSGWTAQALCLRAKCALSVGTHILDVCVNGFSA